MQHGTSMEQKEEPEDTCLVLIGSGAAFLDVPKSVQYSATKWGMRGVMHSLRRATGEFGGRVDVISPWYVAPQPTILPPSSILAMH